MEGQRIALWGTSPGACHVFAVAVERPQVKCIIRQMGFADGDVIVTGNNNALISDDCFRSHFTPALAGFFIRAVRAEKTFTGAPE
ncbi:hypothetical protein [Enterobacter mori]|uniref:hypothetical protein n=1 Tax=Enterobacter mori TaxID=539813 RepID=UPI003754B729